MSTEYKIYIVNQQDKKKKFWCFLSEPQSEVSDKVFANSSTYMTLSKYERGDENAFIIPLEFKLKASSHNKVVGISSQISTHSLRNIELGSVWKVEFDSSEEHINPSLSKLSEETEPNQVGIKINGFDLTEQEINQWYSCLTFGIKSGAGFIGYSWLPSPSDTYHIQPKIEFYVKTGEYIENQLIKMSDVSSDSALITEENFDKRKECTVIYTTTGEWKIKPGKPLQLLYDNSLVKNLVSAHINLTASHSALVELIEKNYSEYNSRQEKRVSDIEGPTLWYISAVITLAAGFTNEILIPILKEKIVSYLYGNNFELKEIRIVKSGIEFIYSLKRGGILRDNKNNKYLLDITKEALEFEKQEHHIQSYKITN
ncbi:MULTISPECIES: hypothetical protein [Photorhabdus]|uniref:hypothetical protein n=1 Tax=Photorhabdus TaxID=29487 RepID=UPI0007B48B0C|nr:MULTISPECIES: hypothetical protein [Photorhabdus]AWK42034.1 hypothetical protein A4R40_11325 [Photorhabdus laumondii subsp. laumondii]AXG42899.1 hypothetical protein PluDJC_12015 [Photorhabdus laumondii subsp. laumondii]MCC8389814.1 hypothetical protein [Photorhabdus laumondii]MCZ1251229.1 hypothetical protein [Photorhabdus laumondii subsp. laumondii]NDL14745.1 hypothetical protein [Photorhabdus laumondii subsp. laumondii]